MPADNSRPITRIVGYVRVSTKMQGASGLGLEAQRAAIEAYAQKTGIAVIRIFEEVESGKRSDRPMLAEAVRLCGLTGAALVAAKVDRFGRKAADLMKLRDARFPIIPLDAPNADGFLFGILALVAEKEAESISQRTRVALAAAKARGIQLGGARSNNCQLVEVSAKGRVVAAQMRAAKADSRAADLAPIIANLRAEGAASLRDLAARLNVQGIPAARGGEWSAVQVARLLARLAM